MTPDALLRHAHASAITAKQVAVAGNVGNALALLAESWALYLEWVVAGRAEAELRRAPEGEVSHVAECRCIECLDKVDTKAVKPAGDLYIVGEGKRLRARDPLGSAPSVRDPVDDPEAYGDPKPREEARDDAR
jgi:hypothetical protein